MSARKRTAKQQARFDAATQRAAREAQDRHRRLEAERIERIEAEHARAHGLDDFWTPWELRGSFYVLEWLSRYYTGAYGAPETFN